jgi:hypothetical protein
MDDFCATETAMRLVMVAYNLMSLFRLLTLQKQPSPTFATLRFNCFAVGSWIDNGVLKMSVPLKRRQWYDSLFSFIENTKLPLVLLDSSNTKFGLNTTTIVAISLFLISR